MLSVGIKEVGFFYIAYSVAVIASRSWVGRLCDRLTPERLSLFILVVLGATMVAVGQYKAQWILVLSGASVGIGYGLAFPTLATIVTVHTPPANRGAAFGFFTMAVDGGFAVGAIAMGAVATAWGYQAIFSVAGIYTLLLCLAILLLASGQAAESRKVHWL